MRPLLSGHLRDLPKCPLNRACPLNRDQVVKIAQCLLTINIQRLLCTVVKLNVVKEAFESSSSLPFITNNNLFIPTHSTTWQFKTIKLVQRPIPRGGGGGGGTPYIKEVRMLVGNFELSP